MVWIYKKEHRLKNKDLYVTKLKMKNVYFIIAIISVSFISCDGRLSKNQSLKEDIEEFSNRNSTALKFSIEPEYYVEIITDTIIEDTFRAKIRNYSMMDSNKLLKAKEENHFNRKFESEILLTYENKVIFSQTLSADTFKMNDKSKFWYNASFEHAWVDQELSSARNLVVKFSFIDPETDFFKLYQLVVGKNGKHRFELLEEKQS